MDHRDFLDFARRAKKVTAILIMTTGGFKTRQHAIDAIESALSTW
ncbi:hypothetical protein [Marinobacterium aestuarii]|nr:hypothetical protein [Marinobacterium aestuarii]